jgi:serine/threonine protein kinase
MTNGYKLPTIYEFNNERIDDELNISENDDFIDNQMFHNFLLENNLNCLPDGFDYELLNYQGMNSMVFQLTNQNNVNYILKITYYNQVEIDIHKILGNINIAPKLLNYVINEDTMCLLMEKIDITLTQYLMIFDEKNTEQMINIINSLIYNIGKMNELGILHNDLHIDNICITNNFETRIIDFGCSIIQNHPIASKSNLRNITFRLYSLFDNEDYNQIKVKYMFNILNNYLIK